MTEAGRPSRLIRKLIAREHQRRRKHLVRDLGRADRWTLIVAGVDLTDAASVFDYFVRKHDADRERIERILFCESLLMSMLQMVDET